jgi:hypothetical protein
MVNNHQSAVQLAYLGKVAASNAASRWTGSKADMEASRFDSCGVGQQARRVPITAVAAADINAYRTASASGDIQIPG